MDRVQIGIALLWLVGAVGIVVLQGMRGLIRVGIMLSVIMALGIFPGRHKGGWSGVGAVEKGEPITDADRARAKEVPGGLDDDLQDRTRVLARGIVKVQLPDGRVVKARTRKIER